MCKWNNYAYIKLICLCVYMYVYVQNICKINKIAKCEQSAREIEQQVYIYILYTNKVNHY